MKILRDGLFAGDRTTSNPAAVSTSQTAQVGLLKSQLAQRFFKAVIITLIK